MTKNCTKKKLFLRLFNNKKNRYINELSEFNEFSIIFVVVAALQLKESSTFEQNRTQHLSKQATNQNPKAKTGDGNHITKRVPNRTTLTYITTTMKDFRASRIILRIWECK